MTKKEKLRQEYEKKRKALLDNAYNDIFGITHTKKDLEKFLESSKKNLLKAKSKKSIEMHKTNKRLIQRDIDEFKPTWFPYKEVISLLQTIDEYLKLE